MICSHSQGNIRVYVHTMRSITVHVTAKMILNVHIDENVNPEKILLKNGCRVIYEYQGLSLGMEYKIKKKKRELVQEIGIMCFTSISLSFIQWVYKLVHTIGTMIILSQVHVPVLQRKKQKIFYLKREVNLSHSTRELFLFFSVSEQIKKKINK